jgi:hypothetical protein
MAEVSRVRWAAIGAAVAVSLGGGGIGLANAMTSSGMAVQAPITQAKGDPGGGNKGPKPPTEPPIATAPAQVVWVAAEGEGMFPSLSAALASISDNSASVPYVVKIAPGTYTETDPVRLKSFVDIEGSGQGITTIMCACVGEDGPADGAFVIAGDIAAEVRHLTVNNSHGGTFATGVLAEGATEAFSLLNVSVVAEGSQGAYAIYNVAASPAMTNVAANASSNADPGGSCGVCNESSSPTMNNVKASATGYSAIGIGNHTGSSPAMNNVIATAVSESGGTGVSNDGGSSPVMTNVIINAVGGVGGITIGVRNQSGSSPLISDVIVTSTGPLAAGVANFSGSSPTISNATLIIGGGGSQNVGVFNHGSSPVIRGSSIAGGNHSIQNRSDFSGPSWARVADTTLSGPVTGTGFTCVGVHDQNFVELSTSCT